MTDSEKRRQAHVPSTKTRQKTTQSLLGGDLSCSLETRVQDEVCYDLTDPLGLKGKTSGEAGIASIAYSYLDGAGVMAHT